MHSYLNLLQLIILFSSSWLLGFFLTYISIKETIIPNKYSKDLENGLQKIHDGNIKRIGGLSIISGFFLILIIFNFFFKSTINSELIYILLFNSVIFIIGFTEDLIKDIKPAKRLFCLFMVTFLWLAHSKNIIQNTNIDLIDNILTLEFFAIVLSTLTIISAINATNMMDGANGLLTGFAILVSIILIVFAYKNNNLDLVFLLLSYIGVLSGFLLFNFPKGHIFLGDGGAYFIGAFLSTILIYMSNNLNYFSMLNALIIMAYPIWELVFTVLRRTYKSSRVTNPDNLHLHTIINANLEVSKLVKQKKLKSNPLTSVIVNSLALIPPFLFLINNYDKDLEDLESISFFVLLFTLYTIIYLLLTKRNKINRTFKS